MAVQFKVRLTPSLINIVSGGWVVILGGTMKRNVFNHMHVVQNSLLS